MGDQQPSLQSRQPISAENPEVQMLRPAVDNELRAPPPVPADSGPLHYLAFVDGLRAISILAVVAYHVGVPGAPGGFVGVDVFFVISGFLIIGQIKDALASKRFSILSFYANRALRILPLFLIVVVLTDIAAPFVLPTMAIAWDFIPSAATAPVLVSNFTFLLTQGYFDISGIEKPLLHTWTLSVEEQFYFWAPILLILVFRIGNRRFGRPAAAIGLAMLGASLAATIAAAAAGGAAFYMTPYRAWEFLAGGLIGTWVVTVMQRLPRALLELLGWIGVGCILLAVATFDARMPYPSSNAVLPVAGAALVIACGRSDPTLSAARFLALRPMTAIGLVSYGWYLWHWPILSFMRIARMDEQALLPDTLGAGVLALALAAISYRYVEQPIRRWRKSPGNLLQPGRIVLAATVICCALAAVGGGGAYLSHLGIHSYLAAHYGIEGRGGLDNGCERVSAGRLADKCFEGPVGLLLGDSQASVLSGSFTRSFDALGRRLVSLAGPGCHPTFFAPGPDRASRLGQCANRAASFERLLAKPEQLPFVILSANWGTPEEHAQRLSELISGFDPRTRILLLGQVPFFPRSSLECVVLSDRFGSNRDRCIVARAQAGPMRAEWLKAVAARFPNVRYVELFDVFCDQTTCRPFAQNVVLFSDTHHVLPSGADRIFDTFQDDFLWLAGKDHAQ